MALSSRHLFALHVVPIAQWIAVGSSLFAPSAWRLIGPGVSVTLEPNLEAAGRNAAHMLGR